MLSLFKSKPERKPSGVILGTLDGKPLSDRSDKPVVVTGPPGRGKTSLLYASLFDEVDGWHSDSCVLWDFKDLMWEEVGRERERMGHNVVVVDIARKGFARYNPLMSIRPDDENLVSDAQLVAHYMTDRQKASGSAVHWIGAAYSYMTGVFIYLVTAAQNGEKCLAGARRHILRGDDAAKEMLRTGIHSAAVECAQELWSKSLEAANDPNVQWLFTDEMSEDDKSAAYRRAVYSSCSVILGDFMNPVLAEQTSESDFRISDLTRHDKPMTLIIKASTGKSRVWKKIYRLIFCQLIDRLTENKKFVEGCERKKRVLLGIDEVLEFGIEEMSSWLLYLREFGIKPVLFGQGYEDIINAYSKKVATTCAWVALAPVSPFEADLMSRMVGEREFDATSHTETKKYWWDKPTKSDTTRTERRAELSASDAVSMEENDLYVFGFGKPILAQRILAFEDYAGAYGPPTHTRPTSVAPAANPWFGMVVPVPPKPPKPDKKKAKNEDEDDPKPKAKATRKKTKPEEAADKEEADFDISVLTKGFKQ